jgi:hypothetical protein
VVGNWSMFEVVVLILAKAISSYECKSSISLIALWGDCIWRWKYFIVMFFKILKLVGSWSLFVSCYLDICKGGNFL